MTGVWQWLTTAPNPRSPRTGYDAGQRGWRLHAVDAIDTEKFAEIRDRKSACGVTPAHGWSLDLFIEDKCERCLKKVDPRAYADVLMVQRRRAKQPGWLKPA